MRRPIAACAAACALTFTSCAMNQKVNDGPKERIAEREPWREQRPPAGAPAPFQFPAYQRAELKNGLTVVVLEDHALPTVHATLVVRAGTALDGKDAGLAALTWDLLDEGAGDMAAAGLATAFGDIGALVSAGASREYGHLGVRVLRSSLERALELMGLSAQRPTFSAADVERVRKQHLARLKVDESTPAAVAQGVFLAELFGADHPYGHHDAGTATSLDKLKPQAPKKFWADHAGPKNAALILIGDVSLDDAKSLAEKAFGKWRGGPSKGPKPPATPKPKKQARIIAVEFAGAPQTLIRVGRAGAAANDADLAAALAMNQVLGGMNTSRLTQKLREELQVATDASSTLDVRLGAGPFVISVDAPADKTGSAVTEIVTLLDTLKTGGVTDEELARAKANYTRTLPGLFALPDLIVSEAAWAFSLSLPPDHQQKLLATVEAVTGDQAKAAGERLISRDDLVIVLVGDRAAIETGLTNKGLPDVVFVGRDGQPVKRASLDLPPGPPLAQLSK